ncbi:hypothetical protein PV08_04414 [Exophiala spinifera]|uniref:tRNA(Phe) 7-[(3-amino-3-carboxypropyl)-4-demethylwyosine(37)-N(4)]-methyltransferase n=1 Tax=Exophiala spinifera TaxID=91928 RepID=A0A0D2BE22_9EURO|nr:uncharacterized protein PV08_04414 [Exophiala spinifera]KIW17223.1 hypothetical protein PV08_04414 [Exophiala spinifera]
MPQRSLQPPLTVPASFVAKKSQILSLLTRPGDDYSDKSPKGTVDHQIRGLIDEINAYDGLVTTSSCAGRVAVFVEGPKATVTEEPGEEVEDGLGTGKDSKQTTPGPGDSATATTTTTTTTTTSASPGGKGGGSWLYVSHDPIGPLGQVRESDDHSGHASEEPSSSNSPPRGDFTTLFNLTSMSTSNTHSTPLPLPLNNDDDHTRPTLRSKSKSKSPRLIHLTFSPLILHIHCATLRHARPVVAAAINSGFRESGVQSLRVLDDPEHGVMVAVRTAGLAFETVVGVVVSPPDAARSDEDENENANANENAPGGPTGENATSNQPSTSTSTMTMMQSIVSEDYLAMCAGMVNERFRWNEERRERFRTELKRAMAKEGFECGSGSGSTPASSGEPRAWEDKEARRRRKREEGLERSRRKRELPRVEKETWRPESPIL